MKTSIKKNLNETEIKIFEKFNNPAKIQDFINTIPMRNDIMEPIVRSPRSVLLHKQASCIEGAMLAAVMLAYHGYVPYLLDLKVDTKNNKDCDHVVAVFEINGHIGAISKTTHAVLRYREPIYSSIRELAMSYFHEYFLDNGKKTLRSYSKEFPIMKKYGIDWITENKDLYEIACALDESPHIKILTQKMLRGLRKADPIEIKAGKIKEN